MKPLGPHGSFLQRLFPVILLPATLILGTSAAQSQKTPQNAAAAQNAEPPQASSDAPITAEDIGDSLLVKRRYHEALDAYKKMSHPSADLWNKMGIAYQMMFDLKDAARCYKESLHLSPAHAWALNNLGTIYDAHSDFAKAEPLYRKAFQADPQSARIAMNLGTNLMTQRKYSEGSEMYKKAMALDPEVFGSTEGPISENAVPLEQRGAMNYYMARDYAVSGDLEHAIKYLRKALNEGYSNPNDVAQDSSFAGLRKNAAYQRLMAEQSKQAASHHQASDDLPPAPQGGDE
ncbi:MAG TPA: tetratricopeptide repeat protein [Terracidiphilus sp.]|nr:tetratricopeptide repeat protein [Terracidiphilus sp.]